MENVERSCAEGFNKISTSSKCTGWGREVRGGLIRITLFSPRGTSPDTHRGDGDGRSGGSPTSAPEAVGVALTSEPRPILGRKGHP